MTVKIDVNTKNGSFAFESEDGEKLLFAGLRAGLSLPYECATGTCGTCKARVETGDIDLGWEQAPGRSYMKAEKREFLMCQAHAKGACAIYVPGKQPLDKRPAILPGYHKGMIAKADRLTHDVVAFTLELASPIDFEAGQFVVLDAEGVTGGRAYSMVNYARDTKTLDFVVKKKPGGKFCDWLFEDGIVGRSLGMFGPLGRATFHPEEGKNVLCIGGGSGIAGMMSIVSRACGENYFADRKGYVFFGVRTSKDTFYLDELSAYVARFPDGLSVTIALSDEEPPAGLVQKYANLNFATGFVHAVTSSRMAGKFENMVAYVGGPPPMVDGALRMLVLEARLPGTDIRYDKFG